MAKIISVTAREVLDSRGNPTVETELTTDEGITVLALAPSGASKGEYEAIELRDGDKKRYLGKGVLNAIKNIKETIAPKLLNKDLEDINKIDSILLELDGTKNKSKLGANATVSVSIAVAKAAALSRKQRLFEFLNPSEKYLLPVPFMNFINGGAHADNILDFQEFMIVPGGFATFSDALRAGVETFQYLKSILKSKGHVVAVGDEGGFAPNLESIKETIEVIVEAIQKAGYNPGKQIAIALDVAASELYQDKLYVFKKSGGSKKTTDDMIKIYQTLVEAYPIISIEDGLAQDDWDGWVNLTKVIGDKAQIVGDDLFVTNVERLKRGIEQRAANAILIKPNQIGTLAETISAIKTAHEAGFGAIISHRSGETEDTTISDLTVAFSTGMIKTGSVTRTERTAKYNQLLRIEEYLGRKGEFAGFSKVKAKI
jgi:enolase